MENTVIYYNSFDIMIWTKEGNMLIAVYFQGVLKYSIDYVNQMKQKIDAQELFKMKL